MPELGVSATTVLLVLVAVFGALWAVLWLLFDYDADEAAQRTADKAVGTGLGAGGALAAFAGGLLEPVLHEPGIIITVLGLGSLFAGFHWGLFLAGAVVAFVLEHAVESAAARAGGR